jgi:hypothetical protein
MFKFVVGAVAAASLATPTLSQTAAQAPAPPAVDKSKDPNRIICIREEVLGSRLGGYKACKTAAEWKEQQQQHREQAEDWQRRLTWQGKPDGT